jgi:hypothetical protein
VPAPRHARPRAGPPATRCPPKHGW